MVDLPTPANLKARYPEFTPVEDSRIALFIQEAFSQVSDKWRVVDQPVAILALAAHHMSLEGEPSASATVVGTPAGTNLTDGKFLKVLQVGDTKNEWAESTAKSASANMSATAAQAELRSTAYGAKFLRLRRQNFAGLRVT